MSLNPEYLACITLSGAKRDGVKRLSGFEKHHSMPARVDDYHNRWIGTIAEKELDTQLNDTARYLRKTLNYKRKDITAGLDGNAAYIKTPTFAYRFSVSLDPESPKYVYWRREIADITTLDILTDAAVSMGLGEHFQETHYHAGVIVSIENLIDTFEDQDIAVDYPHDCSRCSLPLPQIDGQVLVHPGGFTIEYGYPQAPHTLLNDLNSILPLSPDEFIKTLIESR